MIKVNKDSSIWYMVDANVTQQCMNGTMTLLLEIDCKKIKLVFVNYKNKFYNVWVVYKYIHNFLC